jgi:hypothetical protein
MMSTEQSAQRDTLRGTEARGSVLPSPHMGSARGMRIVRSTGVAGGLLIALLGIWGALIPFVGPYFDYSFGTNSTWHYTTDRLWLDILPGAVALLAGFLLLAARTRRTAALGAWLAILAGTWFVIGPAVSLTWEHRAGPIGPPLHDSTRQMLELLGYFYLLGVLIIGLGAFVLGRLVPARVPAARAPATAEEAPTQAGRPTEPAAAPGESSTAPRTSASSRQPARRRLHVPFSHRQRTRS